jgi:hypothetical protein
VDGYRLRFGDNDGNDEIVLQRVDDGTVTDVISSSSAVPNNLTDFGFLIRVTRTESSQWTLYTSVLPTQNGQGAIANAIPSAANTPVQQGSMTDDEYTDFDNGYFGFMAVHASDSDSRTAAEFDQLYFDTSADASLPVELISFTATAGDGEVEINWTTASEIENMGFIILRSHEESGEYSELDSYKKNPKLWGAGNSSEEHSYHYTDYDVSNNMTYWYKLRDVDFYGIFSEYGPISAKPSDRLIEPERFYLAQNYPNPFNQKTIINYELPARSAGGPITNYVDLSIYDILGEKVAILVSDGQEAGMHQVEWDANGYASGVYYYQLRTESGFVHTKKLVLLK